MELKGVKVSKKNIIKVYRSQCAFFGVRPKTMRELKKMTSEELYQLCEDSYKEQPAGKRDLYARAVRETI
jgi:hypothetical protein